MKGLMVVVLSLLSGCAMNQSSDTDFSMCYGVMIKLDAKQETEREIDVPAND